MSLNTVPFNPFPPSSDQKGSGGGGSYVLPAATAETLGGIKVGDNLTVEEDGTLNAADSYTLPIAEDDTLGGVKVGSGLSIDSETGILSADSQMVDYSTTEQATGQKWIDGKEIYRKVVSLGNLPDSSEKKVSAGISGADVIMIEGYYNTGTAVSNLFNITALSNFVYNSTSDEVIINVSSDLSSVTAFAILYYTKTPAE